MLTERADLWLPYVDEELFDLAADFEQYPLYLPGWRSARIDWREGERLQAEQTIGVGSVRLRFQTMAILRRPSLIEVTSDDPQFNHFTLTWNFASTGARACRVELCVELQLRARLLQRLVESVAPGAANTILGAFAERAQQLFASVPDQGVT